MFKIENVFSKRSSRIGLPIFMLGWLLGAALLAQNSVSVLMEEAKILLKEAEQKNAAMLSPYRYKESVKRYRRIEKEYRKRKKRASLKKDLKAAIKQLKQAIKNAGAAEVTLARTIKARSDSRSVRAKKFTPKLWGKGEKKFSEAVLKLEDGNMKGARKRAREAEKYYRKAELASIKYSYLHETHELLDWASKKDVKELAPKTLQRASILLVDAESELDKNRYDTDVARNLARQAKYETKHAIYLAKKIEEIKKNKQTLEAILLAAEAPLQDICNEIEIVANFDEGVQRVSRRIISHLQAQQENLDKVLRQIADQEQKISYLSSKNEELEARLGGISQQQSELKAQIEAREHIRKKIAAVELLFAQKEAQVLREGNKIVIRLVGLNFAVGKAVIQPEYFSLLSKVKKAIVTFPESLITVEGHTDSYGSDVANLKLSQARADAIRKYLLANISTLDSTELEAVGYGESKPIANNETQRGRARNRRIDVILHINLF